MDAAIVLSLNQSPAPGVHWEYEVRLEGTKTGHRVLAREAETGRMRTVRRSRKPLTWRTALADIEAVDATWVGTDDHARVAVQGVCEWQADMLRLVACKADPLPSREANFLVRFKDPTLELLVARFGRLIEQPAIDVVHELIEIYSKTGALNVIAEQLVLSASALVASPEEWLQRVRKACSAQPATGPSLATARSLADAAAFLKLAEGPQPRKPAVRALLFRKWVELVLPTTFKRNSWSMSEQPELTSAEWLVSACREPGELVDAAKSDAALKDAVEQFRRAVDTFIDEVATIPEASSYASGIGRTLKVKAAAKAREVRRWVLGDVGIT